MWYLATLKDNPKCPRVSNYRIRKSSAQLFELRTRYVMWYHAELKEILDFHSSQVTDVHACRYHICSVECGNQACNYSLSELCMWCGIAAKWRKISVSTCLVLTVVLRSYRVKCENQSQNYSNFEVGMWCDITRKWRRILDFHPSQITGYLWM